MLIVQKYGGSSLASPRHILRAAKKIGEVKRAGHDLVIVVSAMGRMTDHLVQLAHRTVQKPSQRELDMLMTAGERVSMSLLAMALHEEGIPAISFTGSQSGIVTSSDHTEARIVEIRGHRIREELNKSKVVIIAGFQGVSREREITTLGRGGSDTTAVALAAQLKADVCEILTDVDGLFSADPKVVPHAELIPFCPYDEGLEMASLGAKMHARSLELARRFKVPVRICSSQNSSVKGTYLSISEEHDVQEVEFTRIRNIASLDGFNFFTVSSELQELVSILEREKITLRFFSQSRGEVSFLCESNKADVLKNAFKQGDIRFSEVSFISAVSAVGDGICQAPQILPKFLKAIGNFGSDYFMVCSNSLSISAAIRTSEKEKVISRLHDALVIRTAAENEKGPPAKEAPLRNSSEVRPI
jgi:aspartate kinase